MYATSPTAVGTVTSMEATTSAVVPWPRLRVAAPTHPSPSGDLIHPQTTSQDASQQLRVSAESNALRGSSICLICSGGTAHLLPPKPRPQQTSSRAVRAQQLLQQHPCSVPARPHPPSQTASVAVLWPHSRRQPRLTHPPPSRDFVRSDSPTAVLANHDDRSPLPSLLRTRPCPQKRHTMRQSCDFVCGGGLRFCSPFSPRPHRRRHPPQPSAQFFLQRR